MGEIREIEITNLRELVAKLHNASTNYPKGTPAFRWLFDAMRSVEDAIESLEEQPELYPEV